MTLGREGQSSNQVKPVNIRRLLEIIWLVLLLSVVTVISKHTNLKGQVGYCPVLSWSRPKVIKMSTNEEEVPVEYKEKKWGREEGSGYITDGYTFRGKGLFSKAWEGLKVMMKKGVQNEIGTIKFKALDVRKKGTGIEVDVEIVENGNRGVAVLKLFGLNSKKENVIMVNKSKESDNNQVIILGQKIVKPLIKKLAGEKRGTLSDSADSKTINDTKTEELKCKFCDKTSFSSPGLKGHVTKMHGNKPNTKNKTVANKRKSQEDVKEVVESLLEEVILIIDDENTLEEESLEEIVVDNDDKKYHNLCEECGLEFEATRKYIAVRLLLKHKEEYHLKSKNMLLKTSCTECEFKAKEHSLLKKHMREEHFIKSWSTSPPLKKKKKGSISKNIEAQNDDNEEILNLSSKIEEMEIDNSDCEEEKVLRERRDLMDKKVIEKEERIKAEELKLEKKRREAEVRGQMENKLKLERSKKETKLRKQKLKDEKKKNKKTVKVNPEAKDTVGYAIPNIGNVPDNCKHLVNKDDVLYLVPGDGCCGPNCASAFLFQDEVYGPKLRRMMNIYFADHWYDRYQYITQCSEENPFIRRLGGGGEANYKDPEELIKYLKASEEAAYMWSDSEDLSIIADMYQIKIKVITTKGRNDKNPTVNWITPDENMKKFSDFTKVKLDDMTLLHEDETHFNLIVSKDSDLATMGSLSYRFNVGPLATSAAIKKDEKEKKKKISPNSPEDMEVEFDTSSKLANDYDDIRKKLKESEASKKAILSEYLKCEKELRVKTEETEKLKTEVKDLKEIIKLSKYVNEDDLETSIEEETSEKKDDENIWKKEKYVRKPMVSLKEQSPKTSKTKEKEFNCQECYFQATKQMELNKHINLKHNKGETEGTINCRNCGEGFSTKWNLMNHRKSKHSETVAYCRNNIDGMCSYSDAMCWWNHGKRENEGIKCYICSVIFKSKTHLMSHRKKDHSDTVKPCTQFQNNMCRFRSETCWFKHEVNVSENDMENEKENTKKNHESQTVFQEVLEDLEPPIVNQEENQKKEQKL